MLNIVQWLISSVRLRRMRLATVPVRHVSLVLLAVLFAADTARSQTTDSNLNAMGLQHVWRTQIQLPVEGGTIVSTHLWTNPTDQRTFAELTLPSDIGGLAFSGTRTLRVSADRLDKEGKPIGIEAAKREVETRATRMLGRAPGVAAVEVTVPMVYLVVVTSDGFVQTFNAESGEKLWSAATGSPRFPTAPASVSDSGIAVAQGPYLYLLDWRTGKELSRREMKRASTAGVALVDDVAFVASLSGQLMAFKLSEAPSVDNWTYRLYGRTEGAPATAHRPNKLVAFATQDGLVTVFGAEESIEPWFNFEARAPLAGPLSFHGDGLYCADVSGKLTKILLDRRGRIAWRLMLGDALRAPPVVFENTVYVTNEIGNMIAADDDTGIPLWNQFVPRVKSILAVSKDRVYCRTLTDRLMAIDAPSGKELGASAPSIIHTDVVNHLNDRVYLVSAGGQITCLRQSGKDFVLPRFHQAQPVPTETPKTSPSESGAESAAPNESTTEPEMSDPFGTATGGADAFGAPATPAPAPAPADGGDPFATPPAAPTTPAPDTADPFAVPGNPF